MIRKIFLVNVWFIFALFLLALNLSLLTQTHQLGSVNLPMSATVAADNEQTDVGGTSQVLSAHVIAGDARTLLLHSFLARNKSPMAPYAQTIVQQADLYGFDFRLVPSIAMCESNLGKRIPTKDSYNAWGIAVYTGELSGRKFSDWEEAIRWVSKYIKEHYYDRGYTDLYDIGAIWAPPSVENGYSWTNCVTKFMESIY
jgi:hypothetical protein